MVPPRMARQRECRTTDTGCGQSHTDGDELQMASVEGAVKTRLPGLQVGLGGIVGSDLALAGLRRLLLGAKHDAPSFRWFATRDVHRPDGSLVDRGWEQRGEEDRGGREAC